jgi:hypothetical protein
VSLVRPMPRPYKGRVADDGREFQKLISIIVDHI